MSAPRNSEANLLFWKHMVNAWSFVAFILFMLHFFSRGFFEVADSFIAVIYPAVLTIYTGQKEFSRWKSKKFSSHFSGEFFVIAWTAVFMTFVFISVVTSGQYRVSLEMATTYLAVLSIYAVTLKSKEMRARV